MSFNPDSDLSGTIARLFVYPVKSCAGIEVREALLTETGLDLDRAWMVVDADGMFLTQRALPRMALIRPQLKTEEMVLRAPGMLALHVAIDAVEAPATVTVWRDTVPAWDMGAVAAQWFTDFLGQPCRLVRFDPEHRRLSSMDWTGGVEAPNQFSDGFPVLVASEASMQELNDRLTAAGHGAVGIERFRPNVVLGGVDAHDEDRVDMVRVDGGAEGEIHLQGVKPCARCPIPDIDPATAESSPEVGATLRTYRADRRLNGAITFGMNAIVRQGAGHVLRVGQRVAADLRFD
ncbi:Fe-S protein [Acidovorax sp. Leaf76]|uniref:MOSC domain-containing protein n=1 Tax=unclassified Acidovorax TaxID=2684926 RepID=UPI0007002484|nr:MULTISPECIES: MOSC N-terminal beta barrel domain-containing protein [unclassified Acidovorax]KQO16299.1 Fe-S protein [Acidovorax sp. Leaf76]KQO32365.1 Fe-S protein [Acidovorax sp. Leaf84]KQS31933.1 Fe-S protein [Acidovorax sp. Leaf191]